MIRSGLERPRATLDTILDHHQKLLNIDVLPVPVQSVACTDIISWKTNQSINVRIRPLNVQNLFSNNKTYFLVGLTGKVELSLCNWMTDHGARYFALANRTPRVNSAVMRYLTRKGANIKVFSLDVTNQTNLSRVYKQIVSSMPPIGGVANGAISLRNKPLQNMSLEDLEVVLQPKVQGSKNLDELFRYEDLEFFILFSSIVSIVRNPAQSNYGAANTFMSTLAAQRRDRGLAASVIGIAMVLGIGYVARSLNTDATIESQIKRFSHLAMSKPKFHTLFAEAVVSEQPNSQADSELLTGFHSSKDTPWYGVAKLSYYYRQRRSSPRNQFQNPSSHRIKKALKNNQNANNALQLLEAAFSQKLGSILQISSEDFNSS